MSDYLQEKEALDFFRQEYKTNFHLANLRTPTFSVMDGLTLGGGVGYALYAHYRIATENTARISLCILHHSGS